jgi:hypothetical protein
MRAFLQILKEFAPKKRPGKISEYLYKPPLFKNPKIQQFVLRSAQMRIFNIVSPQAIWKYSIIYSVLLKSSSKKLS